MNVKYRHNNKCYRFNIIISKPYEIIIIIMITAEAYLDLLLGGGGSNFFFNSGSTFTSQIFGNI
jgi:hypothetical protein